MATSQKRREYRNESIRSSADEDHSGYECTICYKEAVNPVVLSCGHFYCWECIDEWLRNYAHNKKQCPICKKRIQDGGVIPIYGKGKERHSENPRPTAPALACKDDDDESESSTEDFSWIDFLKIGTVVAGLIGAFMLGRQTARRTRRN